MTDDQTCIRIDITYQCVRVVHATNQNIEAKVDFVHPEDESLTGNPGSTNHNTISANLSIIFENPM